MKRVLGIIQARLSSTRLPRKVLKNLNGKPMIQHIVERMRCSKYIDTLIVATTQNIEDDALEKFCKEKLNIEVVRGSEEDVLARFYSVLEVNKSNYIVRITADDPLKDSEIVDLCIEEMLQDSTLDYCSNTLDPTYPEGLDIEVFKSTALETAYKMAKKRSEREHVTPYIWNNPKEFNIKNIYFEEDLSHWRLTVDKSEDFELMEKIFKEFEPENIFSYKAVIQFLKKNLTLLEINNKTIRNEGYLKSLKEDINEYK